MTSQNASAHDEESNPSNRIPAKMTTRFFSRTQAAVVLVFSVGCSIALCGCKNDEGDPEADIMKLWADAVARYRAVELKNNSRIVCFRRENDIWTKFGRFEAKFVDKSSKIIVIRSTVRLRRGKKFGLAVTKLSKSR